MATRLLSQSQFHNFVPPSSKCTHPAIVAAAMPHNHSYWSDIHSQIHIYLTKAIPIRHPKSVYEPMHHLTFAAPSTTAPSLTIAACELLGGQRAQAIAAAAALHLMHAAAYTHENLSLTDRPRPHGRPAIEHKFGPNIELLIGDGIIPYGLELLARSEDVSQTGSDKILRVIIELSRSMGSQGIVDGQFRELGLNELENDEYGYEMEYVGKKKEGELHACGAACGAILGGGTEEEIEKLRTFGMYVGMMQGVLTRKDKLDLKDNVEKLKALALTQLRSFRGKKIEMVAQLLELDPVLATL